MYTQVFQQQIPIIQQPQYINIPSNQAFIGKTLQKNFSTSTLHKAPLPPKFIKTEKSPLIETSAPMFPIGQINLLSSQISNGQQAQRMNENKVFRFDSNISQSQNSVHNQRQNSGNDNTQIRQSIGNVQSDSQVIPLSPYSMTASGMQIVPISMLKNNVSQKGMITSQSINTPLYIPVQNNSQINKIDLSNPSQPGSIYLNQEIVQQQNSQMNFGGYDYQKGIKVQQNADNQQEKLKRSNSEYIPREQQQNADDFRQFQIYLNKVTIDPNDYFTLKPKQQQQLIENTKENTELYQQPQQQKPVILDLKNTNQIDGGGSPFTLNKKSHQLSFQPISQQQQQNEQDQQFSSYIPVSLGRLDLKLEDEETNEGSQAEEVKFRKPPIKTSATSLKIKDNDVITILEIEDYGSIQNKQNEEKKDGYQIQEQISPNFENQKYDFSEIQKYESFGKQNFDSNGVQKYNSNGIQNYNSNGSQQSMLAPYQAQQNNMQFHQGINLLSSINSNVTGNEQSPFCSSFIRQSDMIRRRTNSIDDPQMAFNQSNIQNLFSNPNSTKNAKTPNNPINIVETLPITNYTSQPRNSIPAQIQRQSESIQEMNEEYSESIVLDKFNNHHKPSQNEIPGFGGKRNEEKMSHITQPMNYKDEAFQNSKSTDKISINPSIQSQDNSNQNDKFYYLQKADEILSQLGKVQTYTNNINNNASTQSNQPPQISYPNQQKPVDYSSNFQNSGNISHQIQKQQPIISTVEQPKQLIQPAQSITERRKQNIDQIVQSCVERTQNLLEKLKSKSKKMGSQNQKNSGNENDLKQGNTSKNKRHEEIRQSRQKVDQLVNEALSRSRQVVQRHTQSKMFTNSPPYFGQSQENNQIGQNYSTYDDRNINQLNYSPQQRVVTDYAIYNRNQESSGGSGQQKDNNTFGYFSQGNHHNRDSFSPSRNQQYQTDYLQNRVDPIEQQSNYQIKISPVGSEEKSPLTDLYGYMNSGSKENNSISFDIQAGNSGKSNQMFSQDNLSPFKQKIEAFGSSHLTLASPEREDQQQSNRVEPDNPNNVTFDGQVDANGRRQGYGVLRSKETFCLIYEGEWKNGLFHGQGILYNQHPQNFSDSFNYNDFNNVNNCWKVYEGEFENGKRNGSGTLVLTNQEKYSGKFLNDTLNGEGVFYTNDNSKQPIVGQWINNILSKLL